MKIVLTGITGSRLEIELDDIRLLQIARAIHPDKLMELSANLAEDVVFLRELKERYVGFHCSDYAFMILYEWKKSMKNKRQVPTTGNLKPIFSDIGIDEHALCRVRNIVNLKILNDFDSAYCFKSPLAL